VLYEPDLSFRACDDAFADLSSPAFPRQRWPTLDAQVAFLRGSFAALKRRLDGESIRFSTRRQRCLFCARFLQQRAEARRQGQAVAQHPRPS
jgi:hypothetical protein